MSHEAGSNRLTIAQIEAMPRTDLDRLIKKLAAEKEGNQTMTTTIADKAEARAVNPIRRTNQNRYIVKHSDTNETGHSAHTMLHSARIEAQRAATMNREKMYVAYFKPGAGTVCEVYEPKPYYQTSVKKAKQSTHHYTTLEEATGDAQRQANRLNAAVSITYHWPGINHTEEHVTSIEPEKKPSQRAIFRHMENCQAAGMTIEEAAHAWRIGDYRDR